MSKYRKRQGVVDAIQWDGTAEATTRILAWVEGYVTRRIPYTAIQDHSDDRHSPILVFSSADCAFSISPSHWLVRDDRDRIRPYTAVNFEATYEAVNQPLREGKLP